MDILKIDKTTSTNTWVMENEESLPSMALVYCIDQTSGRGQRGNGWESEPGKNITASLIYHPYEFPAIDQFRLSQAVALALSEFLVTAGVRPKIKWPNDIYVGDKKICGILMEHVVTGKNISRTVAGFGLNLNQTEFHSDAPNPVSLCQLTGKTYDLKVAVEAVGFYLERYLDLLERGEIFHKDFMNRLWRYDGKKHKFFDHRQREKVEARIIDVAPDGRLTLETSNGELKTYYFKEIEFILDE